MSNFYLKIEGSTGTLFEQSKTEAPGFERVEYVNPQTKATGVSYRKYHKDGAFGILSGVTHRVNEFDGKKIQSISVAMTDGEDRFFIDIPLNDQKGNINSYAESFICKLKALKEGKAYRVYPYAIEDKQTSRKSYGVAVNIARLSDRAIDKTNKIPTLTYTKLDKETGAVVQEGDIPPIEWETSYDGQIKANKTKRNAVLFQILKANEIAYQSGGTTKTFDSTAEDNVEEDTAPANTDTQNAQNAKAVKNPGGAVAQPNTAFDAASNTFTADEEDSSDDLPF
jgi:hypothetical protein